VTSPSLERPAWTTIGLDVPQLTLLAPDIVQAILDGRQPAELDLPRLMRPLPIGWREQNAHWAC
jgi:hypothetical protein